MTELAKKQCIPCQGGVPPLPQDETNRLLQELGGHWQINDLGHLEKAYAFKDFMTSMNFANQIAELAEKEAHHPDITISWGQCRVEIWTHKINGLTESDFILAAKIERLEAESRT